MARLKPVLTVITPETVASELEEIYRYNSEHQGFASANRWEIFLRSKIASLASDYDDGRPIKDFPGLRCITAKRRSQGHGHYIIYEID